MRIKENEKKGQFFDLANELKYAMEHEGDTNCNWCTWNDPQKVNKRARGDGNRRTSGDHSNYSIVEVDQKSLGYLRRPAVTCSSERPSANAGVKNSQGV